MTLPLSLSRPLALSKRASEDQHSDDAPLSPRDCVGAALLFVALTAGALAAFSTNWAVDGIRPLPEATRMMVITPLPR